jgi:dephospho-CoA kinase
MIWRDYVFGFGSLVDLAALAEYLDRDAFADHEIERCRLRDYRRAWNIARDNSEVIPGHDHLVCSVSGERLDGYVTVVNIRAAPGHAVNGIAFRVSDAELAVLDRRERNYNRIEVTDRLDVTVDARVWAYRGKPAAEARYAKGVDAGTAVINSAYHTLVHLAFESHGPDFLADYLATTDPPDVPLRPLQRVRTPG